MSQDRCPELYTLPGPAAPWLLAMHLISDHADPMAICRPHGENFTQHVHEHTGPCTIRDHDPTSRHFDEEEIELVLEECEEER